MGLHYLRDSRWHECGGAPRCSAAFPRYSTGLPGNRGSRRGYQSAILSLDDKLRYSLESEPTGAAYGPYTSHWTAFGCLHLQFRGNQYHRGRDTTKTLLKVRRDSETTGRPRLRCRRTTAG